MGGRKLRVHVHVDGAVYGPENDDLPPEVVERITNPDAWEGEPEPNHDQPAEGARRARRTAARG